MVLTWLKNLLKIVRGRDHHQVVFSIHLCWLGAGIDITQSCFLGSGIYPLSVRPYPYACRTVHSLLQLELLLIKFNILPLASL